MIANFCEKKTSNDCEKKKVLQSKKTYDAIRLRFIKSAIPTRL